MARPVGNLPSRRRRLVLLMPTRSLAGSPADRASTPERAAARPSRRPRHGLAWRAVFLVAVLGAAAVPIARPGPARAAGARPDGPLVPVSGFYVGAYTKSTQGYAAEKQKSAILDLESRLGRRLHIDHHFYAWEDNFPSWREPWDIDHGRIPMISWNGTSTEAIASGAHDGLILARAEAVRNLGKPVFLRWFWEMDGRKKAHWAISPESYVAAWRRIHDLFKQRGASNAIWVWCPNASAFDDGRALGYYPGDAYVDWVCADGYNFAPNRPGDRWRNFEEIFDTFYAAALKLKKPMMIGEIGALEREPGEKGEWFRHGHDIMAEHFPAIAAVVYFNADSEANGIYFDWRVDTSPESFEGFRYMFTGPPPVPKAAPPPPPPPPPPVTAPAPAPAAPKPAPKARPPAASPAPAAARPAPPEPAAASKRAPAPKAPSHRLTWVLQLLRQLDSATVPLS